MGAEAEVDAGTERPADRRVLPRRPFGRGVELLVLGFGGAALVARWGSPLSFDERVQLVRHAYERGIRYFDTAGNYLESQRILGVALQDVRREVFLVTKVETTDPAHVRPAVESSLRQLRTDYLDGVLIHGAPGLDRMTVSQVMKVHGELARLRDKGLLRTIGFSAHSHFDKALTLVESGGFDHCLLAYTSCLRRRAPVRSQRLASLREACIARAHRRGMGIAVMNVLARGVLGAFAQHIVPDFRSDRAQRLPGAAIRRALSDPRVAVLVIGMRFRYEIDQNVGAIVSGKPYGEDDRTLLADFWTRAVHHPLIARIYPH